MTMHEEERTASAVDVRRRKRSLIALSIGNVLEWFDWTVYTVASIYIAKALFESGDPLSSLLQTLAVFAIGFLMRPVGGVVFGYLADRIGRRGVLLTTMLLMAAGSVAIGVAPSYAQAGALASVVLLVARLVQGFAHGGESTTSYAYVAEIAPPKRRGFWSSAVFVAVGTGSLLATVLMATLTSLLTTAQMEEWGWRIPFLFGGLLAVVVMFLRRGMMESAPHAADGEATPPTAVWSRRKVILAGAKMFVVEAGATLTYYTWVTSAAIYAIGVVGMDPAPAFVMSAIAQLIYVVALPLLGWLSDRWGRKVTTLISLVGIALTIYPLWSIMSTEPWTLLVAQTAGLLLVGFITGSKPAAISEQIPDRYRTRVLGTSISLGVAVFGGTASYLSTWLYGIDLGWVFSAYVIVVAVAASCVVLTWRRNTGIPLDEVA